MRFRIKRGSSRTVLELPSDGECTFEALESAVSKHYSLRSGTFVLSLNGRQQLQLGERDRLYDAGIRSGDLIVILEACDSVELPGGSSNDDSLAAGYSTNERQRHPSGGSLHETERVPSLTSWVTAHTDAPDDRSRPASCEATAGVQTPLRETTNLATPSVREGSVAQPEASMQMTAAEQLAVSLPASPGWHIGMETKTNRCLREPLLVSEANEKQIPESLATALQAAVAVDGWSESDVLFAVLHVLMVESGYVSCELPTLQPEASSANCLVFCGRPPPSWKTSFGYSVRYVHPVLGDAAAFCMVGMTLGPTTLVVRATVGNKCLAVTELRTNEYVNRSGTGLKPLKAYKLARLSCMFKDAFAHRLLGVLEESLSPPEENKTVEEEEGTSRRVWRYGRWFPDLLRLPAEILFYLLSFLNPHGLVASSATCHLLLGACRQPLLWRRHYVTRFGTPRPPTLIGFSWYEEYVRQFKELRKRQRELSSMTRPFLVPPSRMPFSLPPPFNPPPPPVAPFFIRSNIDPRVLQHFQPLRRL